MSAPVRTEATAGTVHVVFVHGLFSGPEVWQRFKALLEEDAELHVTVHCFEYHSPFIKGRPDRQVPEPDDIADHFGTYLGRFADTDCVVLVGHSQGGLIIQRYISRTLHAGKGHSLACIQCVVTYACPNGGSTFFATARRFVFRRNAQVRALRVFNRGVLEAQRHVMSRVVGADARNEWQWPIPIHTYGGTSDGVVPARVARGPFPEGGALPGDHSTVVQPRSRDAESYRVLKERLLAVAAEHSRSHVPRQSARTGLGTAGAVGTANRRHRPRLQGREREVVIRAVLSPPSSTPGIHVLTGLGGSGKTRVAQEIAERAGHSRHVWWIEESRINSRLTGHRAAWEGLGLPFDPFEECREALGAEWPGPVRVGTRDGRELAAGVAREPNQGFQAHFDDSLREFTGNLLDATLVAQFAFNLYLSVPVHGGETVVWRRRWEPADEEFRLPQSYGFAESVVGNVESFELRPQVGAALLFDPRNYHAVRASSGGRRIALGFSVGLTETGELLTWG